MINFGLDILEYCRKNQLLQREQHYINILNPEFNILKIAHSRLGHKVSENTKKLMSKSLRGRVKSTESVQKLKNTLKLRKKNNLVPPKVFSDETKSKFSLNNKGITVKIFDYSMNFINEFSSIRKAAEFLNVHPQTLHRIYSNGISYDQYIYKFETKNLKIQVFDSNFKLINIFENAKITSITYDIPTSTLSNYIKSGKLYNNTYYFKKIK